MTTRKTQHTSNAATASKAEQDPEDLRAAYQIHTLAQAIYGRLAVTHPWVMSFATPDPFSEPHQWPPTVFGGAFRGPWPWER